jgi:hypothetical protein
MNGGTLQATGGSSLSTSNDVGIDVTGATISALNHSSVSLSGGSYTSNRFVNDSTSSFVVDAGFDH